MTSHYFKNMKGCVLTKEIPTGGQRFKSLYARVFNIEILGVVGNKVMAHVTSYDKASVGFRIANTSTFCGEVSVDINEKDVDDILFEIIAKADGTFIYKHQNAIS